MSSHPEPQPLPDIDDRLAVPGTRFEVIDGAPVYVPPAKEPHGERHADLIVLVSTHLSPTHKVAADVLTRVSPVDDIAPDVIITPRGRDPHTGGRQLPEVAFEVASTQTMADAAKKAQLLVRRGVRRVFVIHVRQERLMEWSEAQDGWVVVPPEATIEDRVFAASLSARDVAAAARTDDAVARALIAKENPVLQEREARVREEALVKGEAQGLAQARQQMVEQIRALLQRRGLVVSDGLARALAEEHSIARLTRWASLAGQCADPDELLRSE